MTDVYSPLGTVAIVGGCLVVLMLVIRTQQGRNRKLNQEKGLQWLFSLRVLLANVQKHRGLSTGYLNGGGHLERDIASLQQLVSRDIASIANVDEVIEENSRWQGITQHWARLAGNYKTTGVENNLSQHNHLIKNILYLIDDLAQDCELLLLKSASNRPLHLYWRELLAAAEHIGQARAIGTGVSAAAHCDSVSRIRLNFLCQQIENNVQRLWKEIGVDSEQSAKISVLITCIQEQLIVDSPDIDPNVFFRIATDALDGLLAKFDQLVKELQWH